MERTAVIFLRQLLKIAAGYFAATIVALAAALLLIRLLPLPDGAIPGGSTPGDIADFALFAWVVLVALSILPVLLAAALAEAFRLRSLVLHLVTGAAIGFLFAAGTKDISSWIDLANWSAQDIAISAVMIFSGALGGAVYWAIAGRYAGRWREA